MKSSARIVQKPLRLMNLVIRKYWNKFTIKNLKSSWRIGLKQQH